MRQYLKNQTVVSTVNIISAAESCKIVVFNARDTIQTHTEVKHNPHLSVLMLAWGMSVLAMLTLWNFKFVVLMPESQGPQNLLPLMPFAYMWFWLANMVHPVHPCWAHGLCTLQQQCRCFKVNIYRQQSWCLRIHTIMHISNGFYFRLSVVFFPYTEWLQPESIRNIPQACLGPSERNTVPWDHSTIWTKYLYSMDIWEIHCKSTCMTSVKC